MLNQEYATQIARDWDANNSVQKAGYATRFFVESGHLERFKVHTVGSSIHQEYCVPAAQLAEFNANIVGTIEVIAEFHSR